MSRSRSAVPILAALAFALTFGQAVAQPAPPAASTQTPLAPPASETPPEPGAPQALQPGDAFGQEVELPPRNIIYLKGHTNWDTAFDTLADSFKSLRDYLDKQGIKPSGLPLTIYTQTDDTGFQFEAAYPIAEMPKDPPKGDIAVGPAPSGKALKFVHRGSYDAMDTTYEAITNYLDDKQLEAKDLFIEEYTTEPVAANADKLVVNVFVPIK
ncbi:MAG TPA: GyrI-like domain-containing protein [Pseudolabrys sp.]|nr:GyrI-like domain-containing protein [Pseudolabrys sp.]